MKKKKYKLFYFNSSQLISEVYTKLQEMIIYWSYSPLNLAVIRYNTCNRGYYHAYHHFAAFGLHIIFFIPSNILPEIL